MYDFLTNIINLFFSVLNMELVTNIITPIFVLIFIIKLVYDWINLGSYE